ncbi:MAG TPA: DUF433 domain-containing protein [Bradyrhizobium sp.]|nr:DUF433 domain-containing protein [Bradyrhizobium sp.]HLZ00910.1 DUF433 domain-containing protein [Bradyrhizobium sp.]
MNPHVVNDEPVIRGTAVPVELILRKLAEAMSPRAISPIIHD